MCTFVSLLIFLFAFLNFTWTWVGISWPKPYFKDQKAALKRFHIYTLWMLSWDHLWKSRMLILTSLNVMYYRKDYGPAVQKPEEALLPITVLQVTMLREYCCARHHIKKFGAQFSLRRSLRAQFCCLSIGIWCHLKYPRVSCLVPSYCSRMSLLFCASCVISVKPMCMYWIAQDISNGSTCIHSEH